MKNKFLNSALIKAQNIISRLLEPQTESNEKRVSNMLNNIFAEKSTFESILIFNQFEKEFKNELSKRNLNAEIEISDINAHFRKANEIEVIFNK